MRAVVPNKSWRSLSEPAKKEVTRICDEQIARNIEIVLDIYIKTSILMLHDVFGFGEQRCTRYLVAYKRSLRKMQKSVNDGTQNKELDAAMRKIFHKNGYPDDMFKMCFQYWSTDTKEEDDNGNH